MEADWLGGVIEPPIREAGKKTGKTGDRKRIEAKMFLRGVAERQKATIADRIRAQKAVWEPPTRKSPVLHIFDDSVRVLEQEKLWKELNSLLAELSSLRTAKFTLETTVKQAQIKLSSVHHSGDFTVDEIATLRDSLNQQRDRLTRELSTLVTKEGKRDTSIGGVVLNKCIFCLENADRYVPDVNQKVAELRLKLKTVLDDLERDKNRLETREKAGKRLLGVVGNAPNVERQEKRLRMVQGMVAGLEGRLKARKELINTAQNTEEPPEAVAEALEKVREADDLPPHPRSRSVTLFSSKDAWAAAPSSIRLKLTELHKEKQSLLSELSSIETDLCTPIEQDAYQYSEVRRTMVEKKVSGR